MGSCMENPRPGWPGGTVGGFYQDLGARPASPADVAAWRRNGSPDHWQAWQAHQTVSAHPGPRHWDGPKTGQEPWGSDASLPSDPAKLKAVFLAHTPGPASSWAKMIERQERISYQKFEEDQFVTYVNAVLIGPVSPAVRAAAFQLLAGIKGVQMKPGVRGPEGQVGTAVWTGRPGSMPAGDLILIDPATGNLLAHVGIARKQVEGAAPGTILTYTAFLDAHWTNHPPAGYLKDLKAHGVPTP